MQLLTHRVQVLLLVIVGGLAGLALCCVALELLFHVPVLEPFGVDELLSKHEQTLPSQIVIEGSGAQSDPDSKPAPSPVTTPPPR